MTTYEHATCVHLCLLRYLDTGVRIRFANTNINLLFQTVNGVRERRSTSLRTRITNTRYLIPDDRRSKIRLPE